MRENLCKIDIIICIVANHVSRIIGKIAAACAKLPYCNKSCTIAVIYFFFSIWANLFAVRQSSSSDISSLGSRISRCLSIVDENCNGDALRYYSSFSFNGRRWRKVWPSRWKVKVQRDVARQWWPMIHPSPLFRRNGDSIGNCRWIGTIEETPLY